MKFSESIQDAAKILKTAVPDMAQHHAPVNPYNYSLWYAHIAGSHKPLTRELQQLLKTQGNLSPEQSLELFKKHIINDLLTVDQKLEDGYQSVMSSVSESASKTQESTGDLEKQLLRSLKQLNQSDTRDTLHEVINTIARKTREVSQTTQEFRQVLNNAQQEIDRLKEELKEARAAAEKDALTQLFNRRYFDVSLSSAISNRSKSDTLALMLIDVDHFKGFNDNYGHLMGDQVLKAIARILAESCLDTDHIPCRFGGEEFCILMPKTSMREAKILAENTLKKIASLTLKDKRSGAPISKVTASFGLSFANFEDDVSTLIDRADKALYRAKKNGRNQVVSF